MSKTLIEKITEVGESLHAELKSTRTIDANDNILKPQMFIDIISHKEDELRKFYAEVENEAGVITDRNAFNILEKYMWHFGEMKEKMSMTPEEQEPTEESLIEKETAEETSVKPSAFKAGIKRLFGKIKAKITPTNSTTNNR